jgi:hypothetical protein
LSSDPHPLKKYCKNVAYIIQNFGKQAWTITTIIILLISNKLEKVRNEIQFKILEMRDLEYQKSEGKHGVLI